MRLSILAVLTLAVLAVVPVPVPTSSPATTADQTVELPRDHVDLTRPLPRGREISVAAGGDLQVAVDAARGGDVIVLAAGATFSGPIRLPAKDTDDWIVIRGSDVDRLPPPGTRIDPSPALQLPVIESDEGPAVETVGAAHHYWFIGIEFRPRSERFLYNVIQLGNDERAIADLPHHFVFDRCYIHGDPARGSRRGVVLNSGTTAVVDSYLADFKEVNADSQAIAGWNGPGPFAIINTYLEAAGENVMFGGADPSIRYLVPSDIEIRDNHFFKPLAWKIDAREYAGTPWTVKNLLELKNARRVVIDGNVFEHNWVHGQNGFAILFTVRNQDGTAPWSVVEDVTFTNNVVRDTPAGINILGQDDLERSEPTRRIVIRRNVFEDVGRGWDSLFQLLDDPRDVVIADNEAR